MKQAIVFLAPAEYAGRTGVQDTESGVITFDGGEVVPDFPPYSYKSQVQAEQDAIKAADEARQQAAEAQAKAEWDATAPEREAVEAQAAFDAEVAARVAVVKEQQRELAIQAAVEAAIAKG